MASLETIRRKRILVVDDFSNVRKSIRGMLASIGVAEVLEAESASQALSSIREHQFDMIICDYNLGNGRDGQQLLEELRANLIISNRTVYVMITAETSRDMVMGAIEFRPDDYLAKPFTFETLKQRFMRWIDRQEQLGPLFLAMDKRDDLKLLEISKELLTTPSRYKSFVQRKAVEAMVRNQQFDQAKELIYDINQSRIQSWTQLELAKIEMQQGKFPDAIAMLQKTIDMDANLLSAYDHLSQCYKAIGEQQQSQDILKKGVARSPRNILRQRNLGDTSLSVDDIQTAAKCFKDVMQLADQTMHDQEENYERFVRVSKDLFDQSSDAKEQKRILIDARKYIAELGTKYQASACAGLFTKVFNYQFAKLEKDKSVHLEGVFEEALELKEQMSIGLGSDVAQILYEQNRYDAADQLVEALKEVHKNNDDNVEALNILQSEPISRDLRIKVQKMNLNACLLYEKKQFSQAASEFKQALILSPRHPGMILNYIQSTMQIKPNSSADQEVVSHCLEYVNRLNYLKRDHYQFERYQSIAKKLGKIMERFNE